MPCGVADCALYLTKNDKSRIHLRDFYSQVEAFEFAKQSASKDGIYLFEIEKAGKIVNRLIVEIENGKKSFK